MIISASIPDWSTSQVHHTMRRHVPQLCGITTILTFCHQNRKTQENLTHVVMLDNEFFQGACSPALPSPDGCHTLQGKLTNLNSTGAVVLSHFVATCLTISL